MKDHFDMLLKFVLKMIIMKEEDQNEVYIEDKIIINVSFPIGFEIFFINLTRMKITVINQPMDLIGMTKML